MIYTTSRDLPWPGESSAIDERLPVAAKSGGSPLEYHSPSRSSSWIRRSKKRFSGCFRFAIDEAFGVQHHVHGVLRTDTASTMAIPVYLWGQANGNVLKVYELEGATRPHPLAVRKKLSSLSILSRPVRLYLLGRTLRSKQTRNTNETT
jgi:hypothetical protein